MRLAQVLAMLVFVFVFMSFLGQSYAENPNTVGMWLFDEGSGNQVRDSSGNGHTGVAADGELNWGEGKFGKALELSGDGPPIFVEHDDAFNLDVFTIECWVKVEAIGDWQTIVAKRSEGATDTNYIIEIHWQTNIPRAALSSGGVWKAGVVSGTTVVTDGTWHHLATTYDGKEFKIYMNGELEGTQAVTLVPDNSDAPVSIGGDSYIRKPVNGLIDEVQILSVALSQDEIQRDMEGLKPAAVEPLCKLSATWGSIKN